MTTGLKSGCLNLLETLGSAQDCIGIASILLVIFSLRTTECRAEYRHTVTQAVNELQIMVWTAVNIYGTVLFLMSCDYRRFDVTCHPRASNALGCNTEHQIKRTRN